MREVSLCGVNDPPTLLEGLCFQEDQLLALLGVSTSACASVDLIIILLVLSLSVVNANKPHLQKKKRIACGLLFPFFPKLTHLYHMKLYGYCIKA